VTVEEGEEFEYRMVSTLPRHGIKEWQRNGSTGIRIYFMVYT